MDLISQQIMQSWFTGSSVTKEDILRSLCNQPSTILYQVVADFHDWFFNVTQPPLVYKKMRRQTQVSVPTCGFSTEQYANAHHKSWVASFRCISNWPQGFHDLLTGWPSEQGLARERSLAMFRLLFESGVSERWRKPDYAFMRDAFYEHLVTHHEFSYERLFVGAMHNDSNLLDRWEYFTASEAVDRLRLPSYYLDLVCEAAKSRVRIIASHKSQSWVFFEKSYIAMLVAMREALLPVEAIEFILGASENELLSLARSGLLAAVETTVDDGTSSVMFHFGSVQELLLNSNLSERLWSELPTEAFPFLITLSENRNRMRESAYRRVMQWCQALESLEIFSQSDSIKGATVGSLRKLALDMGLPNVEDCGPYRLQLVKTRRAGVLV